MAIIQLSETELQERIKKNFRRLCEPYYSIENVFSTDEYDWPGDKEGRALLAFASHAKIHGQKVPCMDLLMEQIPEKTNQYFYFGECDSVCTNEQQLSGHSWYLRGLMTYYELYHDQRALKYAASTVEHLYLNLFDKISAYPLKNETENGGVSGHLIGQTDDWILSSDTGCAFMSIDGLSHYYCVTEDARVLKLIDKMQLVFDRIDKEKYMFQTHCCLTAARGMLRLYNKTKDNKYLDSVLKTFKIYIKSGMTYTYQNFNWWGKGDTWTESCAVVDSLMLFCELYKITKKEQYRDLAAKVWHNGFSPLQVGNGGAGTTTTVSDTEFILHTKMYEAPFCCTMRLAEGLRYIVENKDLLYAKTDSIILDTFGRYTAGDILYGEPVCQNKNVQNLLLQNAIEADGKKLIPIPKYYRFPKEITDDIRLKMIFRG